MKLTKILGVVGVVALALMAFAGTASATTLTTNGVNQTGAVTLEMSFKRGTSLLMSDTSKSFGSTCAQSVLEGSTSTFTGTGERPDFQLADQ